MASFTFKYESLLGGLNNVVDQGEVFLVEQMDAQPNASLLTIHISKLKDVVLFSHPKFVGEPLEIGETFETINWRIERLS